jgi:3-hydroxybutyryl-CoA dehydrogenase
MINSVCICGAGTMGSGIAQVAATSNFHTILFDLNEDVLQRAKDSIRKNFDALIAKQKITQEQADTAWENILFTNDLQVCLADLFIEAIHENLQSKIALFNQLAELNHSECVFATNTSSLPVTAIAEKVMNPERVIGMHFFNPAPLMKLVEVVSTKYTNQATVDIVFELSREMGKTAVSCIDSPGFLVNRVARPYYIESLRLLEEGHADIEQLDQLLESTGFKLGPFRLMDLIGNDINYAVSSSVYEQLDKPERLLPSYIQKEKVDRSELGRKTKKGYYNYE